MDRGTIYILTNPSFQEATIKVGWTSRKVEDRVKELRTTGVPTDFEIVYQKHFDSCCKNIEKIVHQELEKRGYRIKTDREFFNASVDEVIHILNNLHLYHSNWINVLVDFAGNKCTVYAQYNETDLPVPDLWGVVFTTIDDVNQYLSALIETGKYRLTVGEYMTVDTER